MTRKVLEGIKVAWTAQLSCLVWFVVTARHTKHVRVSCVGNLFCAYASPSIFLSVLTTLTQKELEGIKFSGTAQLSCLRWFVVTARHTNHVRVSCVGNLFCAHVSLSIFLSVLTTLTQKVLEGIKIAGTAQLSCLRWFVVTARQRKDILVFLRHNHVYHDDCNYYCHGYGARTVLKTCGAHDDLSHRVCQIQINRQRKAN